MRIHYFYREEQEKEYMAEALSGHDVLFHEGTIQDHGDLSDEDADALCVFVQSKVGPEVMDRFPNLKLVATRSTGFGHVDLDAAKERGVSVVNVPFYGQNTVAEMAFALLLALARKVYDAYEQVSEDGEFGNHEALRGFDLNSKTIGIIGTGNIGKHSVSIAHGFGMKILAYDINKQEELIRDFGVKYVDLDELLSSSDVISIHVPLNEHTRHMLNKDNMSKIKKGAYLINTARGQIVETAALVAALEDGTLAGAGLDVLEEEAALISGEDTELLTAEHPDSDRLKTLLSDHYLIDHPRVIISPHIGYNTHEAVRRILDTTVQNIKKFDEGTPENLVEARP